MHDIQFKSIVLRRPIIFDTVSNENLNGWKPAQRKIGVFRDSIRARLERRVVEVLNDIILTGTTHRIDPIQRTQQTTGTTSIILFY